MTAGHPIVVIGASAGGVEALLQLVPQLPRNLPAAVFITVHFPPDAESVLPHILARRSALPVEAARDHAAIECGHVYVAPPARHLMLFPGGIRLVRGPTENGNRPAIDPMFRSAAVAYRRRVIGVVLTGNLDDGTAGLLAIKRRGGIAVVQDPADAMFPSMPVSAIHDVDVDHIVPLHDMAALLTRLFAEAAAAPEDEPGDDAPREVDYSALDMEVIEDAQDHPGEPSTFACPDCGGVLWEIRDGNLVRYRCRVGHGWTSDGLVLEQETTLETALWTALRALEESVHLNEQLAKRLHARGSGRLRERFRMKVHVGRERAALVRQLLLSSRRAQPDDVGANGDEAGDEAAEGAKGDGAEERGRANAAAADSARAAEGMG